MARGNERHRKRSVQPAGGRGGGWQSRRLRGGTWRQPLPEVRLSVDGHDGDELGPPQAPLSLNGGGARDRLTTSRLRASPSTSATAAATSVTAPPWHAADTSCPAPRR